MQIYGHLDTLPSFILGEGPLQCEPEQTVQGDKAAAALAGGDEECCQNGNTVHESHLDEQESRPEEEHSSNHSADSQSEGQQ